MNIKWICPENQATRVTEEGRFLPKCFCRKASEALLMRSMATPESISPFNVSLFPIILPVTKVKSAKFWCTEPLKEKDIYDSCCLKKNIFTKVQNDSGPARQFSAKQRNRMWNLVIFEIHEGQKMSFKDPELQFLFLLGGKIMP